MMWKDKCLVLLLSTHALPVGLPFIYHAPEVPQHLRIVCHQIPISPILLEYTKYTCGVDVVDQL